MTATIQVARKREDVYYRFIADDEMPVELRQFAESVYDKYAALYNVGPVSAAEIAMQMVRFFMSSADERAEMVARGEALRAQADWARLEKRK